MLKLIISLQAANQHTFLDFYRFCEILLEKLIYFFPYFRNQRQSLDNNRVVRYFRLSFLVVFQCLVDSISDKDEHDELNDK
jgi:hypothetical protein